MIEKLIIYYELSIFPFSSKSSILSIYILLRNFIYLAMISFVFFTYSFIALNNFRESNQRIEVVVKTTLHFIDYIC